MNMDTNKNTNTDINNLKNTLTKLKVSEKLYASPLTISAASGLISILPLLLINLTWNPFSIKASAVKRPKGPVPKITCNSLIVVVSIYTTNVLIEEIKKNDLS